jgi:hypothetical protein
MFYMMNIRKVSFLLFLFAFLSGCTSASSPDFDIRGVWDYTMTGTGGNTYDVEVITFSSEPARGTFLEVNIYQVEYAGKFALKGNSLTLTGGETWQGVMVDANTIEGAWKHDDGASGTFTASRK